MNKIWNPIYFGRMFEDYKVELSVFPAKGKIFTIGSAGCSSLEFSALGYEVTALDLNQSQLNYIQHRIDGGEVKKGILDWFTLFGRVGLNAMGLGTEFWRTFLLLEDLEEQQRFWDEHIRSDQLYRIIEKVMGREILGLVYNRQFAKRTPDRFGAVYVERLMRTLAHHPNRTNLYNWWMFLGEMPPSYSEPKPMMPIKLVFGEALAYLESQPPASFSGFSLSNIIDWEDEAYCKRLKEAVGHAAIPGATAVVRSVGEPRNEEEAVWAAKDRAGLWGRIEIWRF